MKNLKEYLIGFLVATSIVVILILVGRFIFDKGVVSGINSYHQACRTGGILIDEHGKAVWCKPIDVEKEEMKSAPGLLS